MRAGNQPSPLLSDYPTDSVWAVYNSSNIDELARAASGAETLKKSNLSARQIITNPSKRLSVIFLPQ